MCSEVSSLKMNLNGIKHLYRSLLRVKLVKYYRKGIKNPDCSIISINCVGGGGVS